MPIPAGLLRRRYYCSACCVGDSAYYKTHLELFVEAGHVGLVMNSRNEYLFAQPGMHNINSIFMRSVGKPVPLTGNGNDGVHISHGNRTICIVEQGYIGYVRRHDVEPRTLLAAVVRTEG